MTEKTTDAAAPGTLPEAVTPTGASAVTPIDEAAGPITANKTFWAGVGIGSAALVAALMYSRTPKRKK